jgi:hypothetical protein
MTLDQQQATQTSLAATNNPPPPRNTRYGEQKRKAKKVADKHQRGLSETPSNSALGVQATSA